MRSKLNKLRKNVVSKPVRVVREKLRQYQQVSNLMPRNSRRYKDPDDSPRFSAEQLPDADNWSESLPELVDDVESDDESDTESLPELVDDEESDDESDTDYESGAPKFIMTHSNNEDDVMGMDTFDDFKSDCDDYNEFYSEYSHVASSGVSFTEKVGSDDDEDGGCNSLRMLNSWRILKAATPFTPVNVVSRNDLIASAIRLPDVVRAEADSDKDSGCDSHGVLNTTLSTTPIKVTPIADGEDAEYYKDFADFCNNKIERDSIKEVNSYLRFHI